MIIPVILCGGSGTRLWPLSRKSFPKQFTPLTDNKSLLELTLERVACLNSAMGENILCVTVEAHRFLVAEAMDAAGAGGPILLEPVARNTAAMALAALYARHTGNMDAPLLFCPSDHHIPDIRAFNRTIQQGIAATETNAIVTFGIVPTFPSTAYGYIQQGATQPDGNRPVRRFMEKPDAAQAQALILQGDVLWNTGIFLMDATTLLHAMAQYAPDILESCEQAMAGAGSEIHRRR